jgi:hypothetical protein
MKQNLKGSDLSSTALGLLNQGQQQILTLM